MSADHARSADGVAVPAPPDPSPGPRRSRHLRPLGRPAARRSPAFPVLVGTGVVLVALLALAAMHAVLIGDRVHLDDVQRAVASETEEVQRLRLQVAELESPERILDAARERLGMVEPTDVGYLLPAGVGSGEEPGEGGPVRVPPAEAPTVEAPEVESPDGSVSPEQQAVDASLAPDGSADPAAADTTGTEANAATLSEGDVAAGDAE